MNALASSQLGQIFLLLLAAKLIASAIFTVSAWRTPELKNYTYIQRLLFLIPLPHFRKIVSPEDREKLRSHFFLTNVIFYVLMSLSLGGAIFHIFVQ